MLHFNAHKETSADFVSKHVVPYLADGHPGKESPESYLFQSELDKASCVERFDKIYGEHITMCARICDLTFKMGVGDTVPFNVHNRKTLATAWKQCVANKEDVSRVCWLLFHSHNGGYERALFVDLEADAQKRILRDMGVEYKVPQGCSKKTCMQQLFTRRLAAFRGCALKPGYSRHGTRIAIEDPTSNRRKGQKYTHRLKAGFKVPDKVTPGMRDFKRMVYYIGRYATGDDKTIEWEPVSRPR